MAGEIVISEKPGDTLKKWRNIFKLSQKNLASLLNVKPSVVCDFEKGRRASPGIGTVRKFVEAMVEYDKAQGGKIVSSMFAKDNNSAVYDIREFNTGTAIDKLIKEIDGEILSGNDDILERPIYGYTIVDSLKAITTFNVFGDLYGWSNERAIFFSEKPGDTLKKWRNIFKLSQKNLASLLNVKPSVVCDFEKGRRASPGIGTVRKFVEAMVEYDKAQGGKIVSSMFAKDNNSAVYDIREFNTGTAIDKLIKEIDGEILSGNDDILERPIYGYTIVDSLKAITTFNVFGDLYGWSNERAIFFSGVHFGRSPMIAIRAHPVKPRVVIYIKPKAIDKLATKLAEMERIVLVKTELDEDEIVRILKKFN